MGDNYITIFLFSRKIVVNAGRGHDVHSAHASISTPTKRGTGNMQDLIKKWRSVPDCALVRDVSSSSFWQYKVPWCKYHHTCIYDQL